MTAVDLLIDRVLRDERGEHSTQTLFLELKFESV